MMDAEEFFRREAAELLAEHPDMTTEEFAREVQKDSYDGDPAVAATLLAVAPETGRQPAAVSLVDDIDDEIPW